MKNFFLKFLCSIPTTAQQPNSPTAQQPNSPTAQQPNSPTAQQPNSPTAQQFKDHKDTTTIA